MRFKPIAAILVIVALAGLLAWICIENVVALAHREMADEQTRIFVEMANQASHRLSESPPKVKEAIECLQYAHSYYPSGTKQPAGSHLDRIVERARQSCEKRIIDLLRHTTGKDLGDSPEAWIEKYLSPSKIDKERRQ